MIRWNVVIDVTPHSTGAGADADQKAAGERIQKFIVGAEDVVAAVTMASYVAEGLRANPAVWRADIKGVTSERQDSPTQPMSLERANHITSLLCAAYMLREGVHPDPAAALDRIKLLINVPCSDAIAAAVLMHTTDTSRPRPGGGKTFSAYVSARAVPGVMGWVLSGLKLAENAEEQQEPAWTFKTGPKYQAPRDKVEDVVHRLNTQETAQ